MRNINDQAPYNATLNLTNNCNLACQYCFVHQNPNTMSLEVAQKSIDYLHNNLRAKQRELNTTNIKSNILLFGGEPLLYFDSLIKPLVNYAYSHYPNDFQFDITTNGTLFTDEIFDFMKIYKFQNILVSFDGLQELQDKYRPTKNGTSSYEKVIANLEKYITYFDSLGIRSTVTENNIDLLYENYKFFSNLNIDSWMLGIDQFRIMSTNMINKLIEQFDLIFEDIYETFSNNKIPLIPDIIKYTLSNYFISCLNIYIKRTPEEIITKPILKDYCGFGLKAICIDYAGDIYSCQDVCTLPNAEDFKIGDIYTGIDEKKLNKQRDILDNIENSFINKYRPKCIKKCRIINEYLIPCQITGCPTKVFLNNYIFTDQCILFEYLLDKVYVLVTQLYQEQNNTFLKYLSQNYYYYNTLQDIASQKDEYTKELYINNFKNRSEILYNGK